MDEKTIREYLLKGERVKLECKKAKAEVPKSVWATYSAFANTIGGMILLGIDEDLKERNVNKRFQIIGVENPSKIITDFWNTINSDKVNENILVDSDVEVVNIGGVEIVCIRVPMADYRLKPIYLNGNVYKGTYKRNHEGDYHCTERQVRAMVRDSFEEGNDGLMMHHYTMDDIDFDSLHRYRNHFKVRNDGHVWNEADDKTFLKNLGGYIVDRETGEEGLSMAGLMMFGKRLPVEQIYEGGNSKARNPRIQNMLRMIGFGERSTSGCLPPKGRKNLGSGFPKIIAAWKETNWGEPQLLNKVELDEVELVLPVSSPKTAPANAPANDMVKMSDVLKDVLKNVQKDVLKKLAERQIDILELMVLNPTITLNEMSKRIDVSVKTIQRDFAAVRELGIQINRKDGKTYGEWEVLSN